MVLYNTFDFFVNLLLKFWWDSAGKQYSETFLMKTAGHHRGIAPKSLPRSLQRQRTFHQFVK